MITLFEGFRNFEHNTVRMKFRNAIRKMGGTDIQIRSTYAGDPLIDHFYVHFVHKNNFAFLQNIEEVSDLFIHPAMVGEDKSYWLITFEVYYENYESILRILKSDNPREQAKLEKSTKKYNL